MTHQEELGSIRPVIGSLQGVWNAGGEVPNIGGALGGLTQIAAHSMLISVTDEGSKIILAFLIDNGNLDTSLENEGPLPCSFNDCLDFNSAGTCLPLQSCASVARYHIISLTQEL